MDLRADYYRTVLPGRIYRLETSKPDEDGERIPDSSETQPTARERGRRMEPATAPPSEQGLAAGAGVGSP